MSEWIAVESELPELNSVVQICFLSGYDNAPVYAWGALLDESDGWLWGLHHGHGCGIKPGKDAGWNGIEADDDYKVTHWKPLDAPPSAVRPVKTIEDERMPWPKEIRSFVTEVAAVWDAFELGLRYEISNANYARVREKLTAVETLLYRRLR